MTDQSRRHFLKATAGLAAAGLIRPQGLAAAPAAAAQKPFVRLGGPIFIKTDDPEQLALEHRRLGYRAAYCPGGLSLKDAERIRAVEQAFAKHDVAIAEVGRWMNLMDADPAKRKANMETMIDGLALADAVGARCCVNIAGSFHPTIWFGPDPRNITPEFFDLAVENARKIIDAVKPRRARLAYEMMPWSLPDSVESYLKMIEAVDRPAFAVHLDPCNIVNSPERFYRNTALLEECFDKLGPWIASCHAKDLAWEVEMNVHFKEVRPGTGKLDYATFLRRLVQLPLQPPLMMEHLKGAEEYDGARAHILEVGRKTGIEFG